MKSYLGGSKWLVILVVFALSASSKTAAKGGKKKDSTLASEQVYISVPVEKATICDADKCLLPKCRCGSTTAPNNLLQAQTPQIYMITFDDGVNAINYEIYQHIFGSNRTNPNGCSIRGTFFVSHEYTYYNFVRNLYYQGHEIASHSISHSQLSGTNMTDVLLEIDGQRQIISKFANIPLSDIKGARAPNLQPGGEALYEALWRKGYLYDSSIEVIENDPPIFPYTFDYALAHSCSIPPCPEASYPGLWEVPLVTWRDLSDRPCGMVDACVDSGTTVEEVYGFFQKNFERHYNSNRAPIGAWFHSAWFYAAEYRLQGLTKFLDDLVKRKDVWIVSVADAVMWTRNAVPLSRIGELEAWQCDREENLSRKYRSPLQPLPKRCDNPNRCVTNFQAGVRYWQTCAECPQVYPWVGNPEAKN